MISDYGYRQFFNGISLKGVPKGASIPDVKLAVGNAEDLRAKKSPQFYMKPSMKDALVDDYSLNIEDMGLVGDGIGVLKNEYFDTRSFDLGNASEDQAV